MTQYQTSIRNNFEAPEMIGIPGVGDDEHYTNAVDIWALGYLMYWLLTLELPFPSNKQLFLYCMQEPTPALPRHHLAQRSTSDKAIEFLSELLRPQPKTRSAARGLLGQTWLRSPMPDESVISDNAFQQYRTASSGKVIARKRPVSLRRASPVSDDMRVRIEPDEIEASKEALQQHQMISSETVIERAQPYSPRRALPVRNDVHFQTEPDEIEASEEGTKTTTTEQRISQTTQSPMSYVYSEVARDAPSKEVIASYENAYGMSELTVTIIAADGLYKRDIFRFPDSLAVLTIDDAQTKRTSVVKKTLNPYWNEVFKMRATEDSILCVKIFDSKNFKKKNQGFLGLINVRVGDVLNLEFGGDRRLHPSASHVPDADHATIQKCSREI
jgi:serine/threonine protein kinase